LVGPGCVLHPESFQKELDYLSENGFDTSLVKVHPNCHIIQEKHIQQDKENLAKKLGTTSRGIAPVYADKAARTGIQAKEVLSKNLLWDSELQGRILCEGAQGFWLDLDQGIYPYVTSSTTLPYAACSIGFPPQIIKNVYGAAKIYDTKSGVDPLFPETLLEDSTLLKIGDLGFEFGVTTGRRRIVNWLNLDLLLKAINISGTTHLIISKCDVLESANTFKLYHQNDLVQFSELSTMMIYIMDVVKENCRMVENIQFSFSPETI
jgi:adenylosuccinate synthase